MASFSQHHIKGLQVLGPSISQSEAPRNQALHALLLSKSLPPVQDVVPLLSESTNSIEPDKERDALLDAITARLTINLYAETLDVLLQEASETEAEAEWWANVERSRANVAWYLLQTLPRRIYDTTRTIVHTLRTRNVTTTSLSSLFPPRPAFQPNLVAVSLFPHLSRLNTLVNPSCVSPHRILAAARSSAAPNLRNTFTSVSTKFWKALKTLYAFLTVPFELAQQECHYKRLHLQRIRNQHAQTLGALAQRRSYLESTLKCSGLELKENLAVFLMDLESAMVDNQGYGSKFVGPPPFSLLQSLSATAIPAHKNKHASVLRSASLLRPSALTRMWPKLILLPPICLLAIRALYNRRASLYDLGQELKETARGFLKGWVVDPMDEILKTVRAGGEGDEGIIIRKEGVKADLDSLERMAVSLAQDKLGYTPAQVEALKSQIRVGDLTPVLEIYEEDIKSPLKSALAGTLIRSVFVQVQKTKVDIDQALAGIDKLIKSQELTFAFVGVAPALAVVYALGGSLWTFLTGGVMRIIGSQGDARYGGRRKREGVWLVMRRIERLLISQPSTPGPAPTDLPPLTHGLLLLSLARLREYAYAYLPAHKGFLRDEPPVQTYANNADDNTGSDGKEPRTDIGGDIDLFNDTCIGMRENFLEDIADLEDPNLGKEDKLRVLERMWRCWGSVLGWSSQGR